MACGPALYESAAGMNSPHGVRIEWERDPDSIQDLRYEERDDDNFRIADCAL